MATGGSPRFEEDQFAADEDFAPLHKPPPGMKGLRKDSICESVAPADIFFQENMKADFCV